MGKFFLDPDLVRRKALRLHFPQRVFVNNFLAEHVQNGASLTSFEVLALLLQVEYALADIVHGVVSWLLQGKTHQLLLLHVA